MSTVTMTVKNYNKILAVKNNKEFEDIQKSKELIRLFRRKEFGFMSLSTIFDVYRNFDKARFYKPTGDDKKVICEIEEHVSADV